MRALARVAAIVIVAGICGMVAAQAADRPISAETLSIKRSGSGVDTIVFVSKDPSFLFPAIGSADDPRATGMEIDYFPANQGVGTNTGIPRGPVWTSKAGVANVHRYRSRQPEGSESVLLHEGKRIKLRVREANSPFGGPYGAVFIRIRTGSLLNCAFFDASTIRRDDGSRFQARGAVASSLSDCESSPFPTTTTTLPYTPCTGGAGYPTCDGSCPGTDECGQLTQGINGGTCACFPAGEIPCAESGYSTCSGFCFGGMVCQGFRFVDFDDGSVTTGCACAPPTSSCDTSPPNLCPNGFGLCPPGEVCSFGMIDGTPVCDCTLPEP
jgi:hypothetical protein